MAPYSRVHDNHMGLTPFLQHNMAWTYQTVPNINKKFMHRPYVCTKVPNVIQHTPEYQPHAHECMITQGGYHSPPLKPSLKAEVLSSKGLLSASFIHATFLFDFHPILAHWFAFTSRIRTKWNNQIAFLIECIILHIFGKGDDRITNHFIVPSWINLKSISFGHLINIQ